MHTNLIAQRTVRTISRTAFAESCFASCLLPAVAERRTEFNWHSNVNDGACDGPQEEVHVNIGFWKFFCTQ